ncbi:hypothetical protein WR25_22339 [Diploscapter pachys]|uniref:Uncharacterized protein n=1 Tax=Diploscapter pachys TaxID=2018661 RepID=A0A2A2K590_9BILA|nr:hypothetical protein WR25_22339 [Diploscapter pachys]
MRRRDMGILADRHESSVRQARERFGAAIDRPARHLRRRALCLGARKTGSVAPDGVIALIPHPDLPRRRIGRHRFGVAVALLPARARSLRQVLKLHAMRPPVRAHREGDDIAAIAEQRESVAVRLSLHPQRRIAAERRIAAAQLGTAQIGQRSQPPARRIGGVQIDAPRGGTLALPERTITGAFRVGSTRLGQKTSIDDGQVPPASPSKRTDYGREKTHAEDPEPRRCRARHDRLGPCAG